MANPKRRHPSPPPPTPPVRMAPPVDPAVPTPLPPLTVAPSIPQIIASITGQQAQKAYAPAATTPAAEPPRPVPPTHPDAFIDPAVLPAPAMIARRPVIEGPTTPPPGVPAATFTSSETWEAQRVGALAMYCSDGRWNEACDEFCHKHLLIPRYDRFVLPGGPAWLTQECGSAAGLFYAARKQLDYLVSAHNLCRIVLITHHGCGFYHELLHLDADGCLPVQFQDIRAAADQLHSWYPKLQIEGYLALRLGPRLSFHKLPT